MGKATGFLEFRRELGISDEEFCIGCVGRLNRIKDYPTMLRAAAEFGRYYGSWRLLIAGSGSEQRALEEAAAKGAKLIAFPETFIPGYPWHIWLDAPAWAIGRGFVQRYFDNSLAYDSPQAEKLRAAVKKAKLTAVIGLSEREGGSLYIAQWLIGPDGETIAKRRKLRPTHAERTVYGEGDGSDRAQQDRPGIGRLGALCCWEHLQPLSKYAMYAQNEQVHVASWPSFSLYDPFAPALGAGAGDAGAVPAVLKV